MLSAPTAWRSEAWLTAAEIVEEVLCRAFVANYVPSRGYGRGALAVLNAMEDGRDYRAVAEQHFPGGSFGNGAAMRVAPVGLLFRDDRRRLWEQARLSALPTHLHRSLRRSGSSPDSFGPPAGE